MRQNMYETALNRSDNLAVFWYMENQATKEKLITVPNTMCRSRFSSSCTVMTPVMTSTRVPLISPPIVLIRISEPIPCLSS